MGTLYLVATPIGNLEDITYRAVRALREVDLVAAEDTRHTGRLLKHLEIDTRQLSFHGHSPESRIETLMEALGQGDVALVSDAGMPAVSDPGADLVRAAVERGYQVEVIPGPSAVTAAVALSGLVDSGFLFAGYPPRRRRERAAFLARLGLTGYPTVLFESPHRLPDTLRDLADAFPGVEIAVCRELTKLHESVVRGPVEDALRHFESERPRGEFVLVVAAPEAPDGELDSIDAETVARQLIAQGLPASAAAREVAGVCGLSRSDAYELVTRLKRSGEGGSS